MSTTPPESAGQTERKPLWNPMMSAMVSTLFYDIGLSVIAYFAAELLGASTYVSLLAGTVVSGLRVIWVAVRQRRLDPFALFLVVLFGASLILTFVTGDPRLLLAKDSAQSAIAGLVLVVSCLIRRPLAYYAAQRFSRSGDVAQQEQFQATANTDTMRARWYRVSLVWGCALLADAVLRMAAAFLLPLGLAANLSQVFMFVVLGLLLVWTVRSARTMAPVTPTHQVR